ncbi:MAG TPA: gliding motility lipoprotein GldB [Cytophagaceae bacterium]|nr:gliding motility lipoprotein GldB [Cytophagaceae bacterium]
MKKYFLFAAAISLGLAGCDNKPATNLPEKQEVAISTDKFEKAKVEVKLVRLEDEMFQFKTTEDVSAFLKRHPRFVKEYLEIPNAANEKPFLDQMLAMYTNPNLKNFYLENKKFYGDFSDLKTEMNELFSYVRYYYPDYYVPEVNTLVTGFRFDRDFSFSDSLIVVGIDYFLGKKASYRPQFYDYMLSRYEKPYMVPMMGLAISSKYNEYEPKDETMLSEMIHYGKAHYFLERVLPGLPDSLNIQFTAQEMIEVDQNANVIWGHFIEKKLLFDTNHKTKQRYLGESPKVVAIGDNCPGRIGRWLGWQIVRKYMKENPGVTLQQLMKDKNAQEIFKKSKFKINTAS